MKNKIQITQNKLWLTATLSALVIVLGLIWAGGNPLSERVVTLRMFLIFISGFTAFAMPFLLFPDKHSAILQLGNVSGSDLVKHITQKSWLLFLLAGIIVVILCLGNPLQGGDNTRSQSIYLVYGFFMITGLHLLSTSRYLRSGKSSQFWKESEKGRELRRQAVDYLKYPVDPGSVPSLLNTILIAAAGMLAVAFGALLSGLYGTLFELFPAAVLFVFGILSFKKSATGVEMHYFCTNAFFKEFFGATIAGSKQKEIVKADQLWWVPVNIRSNVWALLVQLDRKFPAGRVIIAVHVLIWLISYQRPGTEVMLTVWLLFSIMHHGLIFLSASDEFVPPWWQRWTASAFQWTLTRFWMQFRWVLILTVSVWLNGFIFGHTGNHELLIVLGVYTISAFLFSVAVSIYQKPKQYS